MGELSKELVDLLLQLMPGFLAAWVLYSFTAYSKPTQFERIIQALIFSFLIKTLLPIQKYFLFKLGNFVQLGSWSSESELLVTAVTGIVFGLLSAYFANNDKFYNLARKLKLTKRTAYPSEWFGAFSEKVTYVVLHLSGNRRIYGWPMQWPSEPDIGHFVLVSASWLIDDKETMLDSNESIMIAAKDVEMVEFLKPITELKNGTKISKPTTTK